jgi:hypothetical protein
VSYARARLKLGISSVGTWVVLAALGLFFGLPDGWVARASDPAWSAQLAVLAQVLLVYIALSLPFDLVGGWLLPVRYARSGQSLPSYLLSWGRGVLVQALALLACALGIIAAARFAGGFGAGCMLLALSLLLLAAQGLLARLVARARVTRVGKRLIWESADPGFSGGWIGLPGNERLIQPAGWRKLLSDDELGAQELRRQQIVRSGSRQRGVALALGFQLLGFTLVWQFGDGADHAAALTTLALGMTLWNFLGLLILPTPSRAGVYEADHAARHAGAAQEDLVNGLRKLDRLQEDEAERADGLEWIFHPVPSAGHRVRRLRAGLPAKGAHHATRTALFLSWACLGFLSRAVHCNAGRPEVWVVFPGD